MWARSEVPGSEGPERSQAAPTGLTTSPRNSGATDRGVVVRL